jgi:hypothetical protein
MTNTNVDALVNDNDSEEGDDLGLPYSFARDYSMADLQEPEDLWAVLEDSFGSKFKLASQEQKLILISIISFALCDGVRFCDACREWASVEKLLPIGVIGSELNHSKGVELLRQLTASLSLD